MTSITGLRYVTPLFELAQEKNILEEVETNLKAFSKLLRECTELESTLLNPRVPALRKKEILLKITEKGFHSMVRDFFCLLVDKGREKVFLFMEQEYTKLLREARNLISATVQAPVPLDQKFKDELSERFAQLTGKTVELKEETQPELIAGIRVLLGSRMLDASLKARLEVMRRHLKQKSSTKTG